MNLIETKHPDKFSQEVYGSLIGIDEQKNKLLNTLKILLGHQNLKHWEKKYHPKGISFLDMININSPLIILSGEVGCGKTALANAIGTPLYEIIKKPVKTFETPSNIRGSGLVGGISSRIATIFEMAKNKLGSKEVGIIIIDEADDLATSRSQNQAHHEDRAGLNVLIKQIDQLNRNDTPIAVILITNRLSVIDPAVQRRATLSLFFKRPSMEEELALVFNHLFQDVSLSEKELKNLIQHCIQKDIPYSYSDLIQRVGRQAIIQAISEKVPFSYPIYFQTLKQTEPSPLIIDNINSIIDK